MTRPSHRRVSRIILLDQHDNFLLFLTASPNLQVPVVRWITPGGGVENHETHEEGALRELEEETGLKLESIGEPFWFIDGVSVFNDGHRQTTHSQYFAVRTEQFEISQRLWMPSEHIDITGVRWWSEQELLDAGEKYSPDPLFEIVQKARTIV